VRSCCCSALLGRISSLSHLDTRGALTLVSASVQYGVALTRTLTVTASLAFVSAALLCSDVFPRCHIRTLVVICHLCLIAISMLLLWLVLSQSLHHVRCVCCSALLGRMSHMDTRGTLPLVTAISMALLRLVLSQSLHCLRSCPRLCSARTYSSLSLLDTRGTLPLVSDSNQHFVALARTLTVTASRGFLLLLCSALLGRISSLSHFDTRGTLPLVSPLSHLDTRGTLPLVSSLSHLNTRGTLALVSDSVQHFVALTCTLTVTASRAFLLLLCSALLCSDVFPRCRIWTLVVLYRLCPRCRIWTLMVLCYLCLIAFGMLLL
jgi:hypothetical protein